MCIITFDKNAIVIDPAKIKLLIVENNKVLAKDIASKLNALGYHVTGTTASFDQAIASIKADHPNLILMDIHLDGVLDGVDLAKEVTTNWPDISVIYLSDKTGIDTTTKVDKLHPAVFLPKPFTEYAMHTNIQLVLANRKVQADSFFVKLRNEPIQKLVRFDEVLYLRASGNYCELYLVDEKKIMTSQPLKNVMAQLDSRFLRIHRSYAINRDHLQQKEDKDFVIAGKQIPIGREYLQSVKREFPVL